MEESKNNFSFYQHTEEVKAVLKYTKEFKIKCEFNGADFKADLQRLHTEVRQCMVIDDLEDFGPEVVSLPARSRGQGLGHHRI